VKQVLIFIVQTLAALLKCCNANVDHHLVPLLSRLLAVIEQIFSWEFVQQSHILYVLIFDLHCSFSVVHNSVKFRNWCIDPDIFIVIQLSLVEIILCSYMT